MIEGHGDDIYRYGAIRCNFSSNISPFIDISELRKHLAGRLEVINHYPEPSAHALELLLAKVYDISPDEVLVTSGATDAIYLIAQTLREEGTFAVKRPTFSEYADACRMFGYQEAPKGGQFAGFVIPIILRVSYVLSIRSKSFLFAITG